MAKIPAIEDIKDEKSFRDWLEDKPIEWARVLASRTALRVMPLGLLAPLDGGSEKDNHPIIDLTLSVFRANLISRVDPGLGIKCVEWLCREFTWPGNILRPDC